MHTILKGTAAALGALALAGTAAATNIEPNHDQYVSDDPILAANIDVDGVGSFTGVLDKDTNELCYMLFAGGVVKPTAAHIHVGGPGENGAPVVMLAAPEKGTSGGCVAVKPDIAQAILANPGGYYVNVHSAEFPGGAVRAQLTKG